MPIGQGAVADEVFELCTFQVAWHHLALGKQPKCGGVAYLAAEFHTGYCGLEIVGMREEICFNLNRIEGTAPGQTDMASALRPYDASEQAPTALRQAKFCCILGARQWKLRLASLQVRGVYPRLALPEEG